MPVQTDRRPALLALEMRTHLIFQNVEKLLEWSGGTAALSASAAQLGRAGRAELMHAMHRFAPWVSEDDRALLAPDECELEPEGPRYP